MNLIGLSIIDKEYKSQKKCTNCQILPICVPNTHDQRKFMLHPTENVLFEVSPVDARGSASFSVLNNRFDMLNHSNACRSLARPAAAQCISLVESDRISNFDMITISE